LARCPADKDDRFLGLSGQYHPDHRDRLYLGRMGHCQGRMCGASVAELVARELGQPVETVGQATPRPPVVPIPLEGLIDDGGV
jgi:hypothetical protein